MKTSERSKVLFFPYDRDKALLRGLRTLFSGVANVVSVGHSVAVKVHGSQGRIWRQGLPSPADSMLSM